MNGKITLIIFKRKYLLYLLLVLVVILPAFLTIFRQAVPVRPLLQVAVGFTGIQGYQEVEPKLAAEIQQSLHTAARPLSGLTLATKYVLITSSGQTVKYMVWGDYLLHQNKPVGWQLSPAAARALEQYYQQLRPRYYGTDLPWSAAREVLPRFSRFTVTDLETGLSFRVQRRAGSSHADVQPLTAQDSATMKEIYGGQWSWRRRAILVTAGQQLIAASMNGMPHGAGAIRGNKFPGHFCIHFADSRVHSSRATDLAHQLMVKKAAGKLDESIHQSQPEELAAIFYTALKQQDWDIAKLSLKFTNPGEITEIEENLQQVAELSTFKITADQTDISKGLMEISAALNWRKTGTSVYIKSDVKISLMLDPYLGRWLIEASSVKFSEPETNKP